MAPKHLLINKALSEMYVNVFLSSAIGIWVGHRNASRPSVCPYVSVLLSVRLVSAKT